jgi:DNA-binding transcriptional LysR family regulator
MNVSWDDLKTVLAVVRSGSLAGAGAALGVNYTTVARRIQRVEAALGLRLFERLQGRYEPTEAAQIVASHASEMEAQQDALLRRFQGRDQSLQGSLVITAPQLLIGPYIAPVIEKFRARHDGVNLRIRATNDLLDLNRREADLAIRISRDPGDTLTGLRLCAQDNASFASPKVAARIEAEPGACVDWLVYELAPSVPKLSLERYPNVRVAMQFDDMVAMLGAAKAGLGVVRMPMFLGRATEGLVQVPVLEPLPYMDIWVVGHPDVWPSAKVAAFRKILVPYFRARRHEFVA